MSDDEDDATIQMDVSAIQQMYGDRSRAKAEGPADDGTTQIDRAELDELVTAERVDRSTMMGYAVGPLAPPSSHHPDDEVDDDKTTLEHVDLDALIRDARASSRTPEPAKRKPDPTQMVDRRAIEMLQSRDEEHALAYQFERGEFSEVSEVSEAYEDDDDQRRLVPTLENPPVPRPMHVAAGDTVPTSFPSPFAGLEPGRPPFSEAPTLGPGPGSVPAIRESPTSPMTMPSPISADLAPLLEPAPDISSKLDADALFGDLGPMTPMSPFDAPMLREPTQDLATSGLVMKKPAKKKSSALPYVVGALLVFAVAATAFAAYVVTSGG